MVFKAHNLCDNFAYCISNKLGVNKCADKRVVKLQWRIMFQTHHNSTTLISVFNIYLPDQLNSYNLTVSIKISNIPFNL